MSKEKLEELRQAFEWGKKHDCYNLDFPEIDWIFQEAEEKIQLEERVKELQEAVKAYQEARDWLNEVKQNVEMIESVVEENQRYKQALEFYALRGNYRYSPIDDNIPPVNVDGGEKARQALKGDTNA